MATVQEIFSYRSADPTVLYRPGQSAPTPDEVSLSRGSAGYTLTPQGVYTKKSSGEGRIYGGEQAYLYEKNRTQELSHPTDPTQWEGRNNDVSFPSTGSGLGQTFTKIQEGTNDDFHTIEHWYLGIPDGEDVGVSAIVRPAGRQWFKFGLFGSNTANTFRFVWFNIESIKVGTVQEGGGVYTNGAFIEYLQNGWVRCGVTGTFDSNVSMSRLGLGPADANGSESYVGDGSSGVEFLYAGIESGDSGGHSCPTSPIFDGIGTRKQDGNSITVPEDQYNPQEGTWVATFEPLASYCNFNNATRTSILNMCNQRDSTSPFSFSHYDGSSLVPGVNVSSFEKSIMALGYDENSYTWAMNGNTRSKSSTTRSQGDRSRTIAEGVLPLLIHEARYIPERLSDIALESVTTTV